MLMLQALHSLSAPSLSSHLLDMYHPVLQFLHGLHSRCWLSAGTHSLTGYVAGGLQAVRHGTHGERKYLRTTSSFSFAARTQMHSEQRCLRAPLFVSGMPPKLPNAMRTKKRESVPEVLHLLHHVQDLVHGPVGCSAPC